MKRTMLLALGACVLLLAGCNPVLVKDYASVPVVVVNGQTRSLQQVGHAICLGAAFKGWTCSAVAPGHVVARITDGSIEAAVDILYGASSYSVHYKDSHNFAYRDGRISPRYNRWVANLVQAINLAMSQPNASADG